ncbi:MAG: ribonuclease E/G, partial [Actinomycetales bacterium]|nr:ribonuclease E/G [Actinomycetales bacterium]
ERTDKACHGSAPASVTRRWASKENGLMVDKNETSTNESATNGSAPAAGASPLFQAAAVPADDAKKPARRRATRSTAPPEPRSGEDATPAAGVDKESAKKSSAKSTKKSTKKTVKKSTKKSSDATGDEASDSSSDNAASDASDATDKTAKKTTKKTTKKSSKKATKKAAKKSTDEDAGAGDESDDASTGDASAEGQADDGDESGGRKRRRRGGRGRRRKSGAGDADDDNTNGDDDDDSAGDDSDADDSSTGGSTSRRRRRRRRSDSSPDDELSPDDPPNTVVKVREPRNRDSENTRGSTRLEAKKQRRREGREAGRRRAPILNEAEFLARRESVERVMVVRQAEDRIQIAVLEDGVLVEHYVTKGASASMVGNVYLGRVQNVLPSMEAAFVDIGRGRNAVLYAGEVNWDAVGLEGQPKRIEFALKSGDPVLVQITKDPVGQKGARLTSQISLPGRFLVYVPHGSMTGISRKLPDNERSRLKSILKRVMPEDAGVIVRTAAEGASEDALEADVERLQALWTDITDATTSATPPELLYSEPDLAIKVVRDMFNEDVAKLVVSGDSAWRTVDAYISAVAPDLLDRVDHWVESEDVFAHYRVDEQLMKALDRKVWLPSGGSLVIDRTEAMTVVDVNTGKFTGSGGNLEQTVTKNNLEAAEEIVRQLRLRDIGGIIVVDFIDMVLESNRDLVLRRLVECLGRDRTKHQVAEVTTLGLVQMTRKRIGSGLLESFSETCEVCAGRGVKVSLTHAHEPAPRSRRPAGAVDPAEVAARALAAREAQDTGEADTDHVDADQANADQADTDQAESGNADAGAGDDDSPELPAAASNQSLFASDD